MARTKKTTVPAPAWDKVEELIGTLGSLQMRRDGILAEIDAKVSAIREQHREELAGLDADIDVEIKLLESAAIANPDQFVEKKSVELLTGTLGFRTPTPSLKTLAKYTWERVLKTLKARKLKAFYVVRESVNKEAILAEREKLGEKGLAALGLRISQDETFYVEPKRETKDQPPY